MIGIAIITNAVGNSHNTPNSTALSDARQFGVLFRSSRNSNGATRIAPITAALGPTRTDLLLSMSGPYQHDGAALGGGASVALLEQPSAASKHASRALLTTGNDESIFSKQSRVRSPQGNGQSVVVPPK